MNEFPLTSYSSRFWTLATGDWDARHDIHWRRSAMIRSQEEELFGAGGERPKITERQ